MLEDKVGYMAVVEAEDLLCTLLEVIDTLEMEEQEGRRWWRWR